MAQPRPSCTIVMDIDEALVDEETRLEIKRCYTHVGTALVRTHEACAETENTIRLLARLGNREFMDPSVEGADELWEDVFKQWLHNEFHNIGNNMMIYNRRQEETGKSELYFDFFEVELGSDGLVVRLHLDSNSMVFPEDSTWISEVRSHYNAGDLGQDVVRVSLPSKNSYESQREEGLIEATKREKEAEEELARQKEIEAEQRREAEERAAENFLERPEPTDADIQAEELEKIRAELEERYGMRPADFRIDYSVWDVEYADGSTKTFDSKSATLV